MSNSYLDINQLAALVRSKRGDYTLAEISKEIGNVSSSTLSRVENGKTPDMETFVALCNWLQVYPGDLFVTNHKAQSLNTQEEIITLILTDKRLEANIAYALAQIVKATYRHLLD